MDSYIRTSDYVCVRLHGDLVRLAPPQARGDLELELAAPGCVGDVRQVLNMTHDRSVVMAVEGKAATRETRLAEGAHIDILPPLAGG